MSERNPAIPFTYKYSQPEEYHFSIDSIEMAWEIAEYLKQRIQEDNLVKKQSPSDYLKNKMRWWKALDVCAGCGVVGFDLNFHMPAIRNIDFVDVQQVYESHFKSNVCLVKNEGEFQFLAKNYDSLLTEEYKQKYQIIVCNPPYFNVDQGKHSPSEFKNRCRFFIDSTFAKLAEAIAHCLTDEGEAFMLLRDLEDHKIDLLTELRVLLRGKMQIENLKMIRGTFLLRLYKQ